MDFNPLFRKRILHRKYCAECHKLETEKNFFTCDCAVFQYCCVECKDLYAGEHKRDCLLLARFRGKNRNVQFANLIMKNEYLINKPKSRSKTTDMRYHIYEQVLDEYLYRFEEILSMGMTTDVGVQAQQDYYLIKMRVPFLLAALGYDDLAITETAVMMDFSREITRIPRNRFDDVLQDVCEERGQTYYAWTTCFLLPVMLVKMRHVLVWRAYTTFISRTNAFPEDVRLCIGEFLIGHDIRASTAELYRQQKQQLRQVISLIKQQDDDLESIMREHKYDEEDEEHDHAEDLLSYIYENDAYGFNDYGLFQFFRGCFRETEAMAALATEFLNEENYEDGDEITWQRNPCRRRIKKVQPSDYVQNQKEEVEEGIEITWERNQSSCMKSTSTACTSDVDEFEDTWQPVQTFLTLRLSMTSE